MIIKDINKGNIKDFFEKLFEMQLKGNLVFRGYSYKEQLNPSLVRNYKKLDILNKAGLNISEYETKLLKQYAKYSVQYLPPYHSTLDWVASAQHFGLPTRLIDWSFDPFCSLYFACSHKKDTSNDDMYYLIVSDVNDNIYSKSVPEFYPDATVSNKTEIKFIDNYKLFVNSLFDLIWFNKIFIDDNKKEFCNMFINKIDEEIEDGSYKLFFCSTNNANPRIIAQNGLFQIPRRIYNEKGEYCISDDILTNSYMLFKIDADCRLMILEHLDKLNINTPRLFPDLQNICAHIKDMETFN